jgi:hypothetical protein
VIVFGKGECGGGSARHSLRRFPRWRSLFAWFRAERERPRADKAKFTSAVTIRASTGRCSYFAAFPHVDEHRAALCATVRSRRAAPLDIRDAPTRLPGHHARGLAHGESHNAPLAQRSSEASTDGKRMGNPT